MASAKQASPRARPSFVAFLNFGIQLVWGAILAVSLPARSIQLQRGDSHEIAGFALLATIGASLAALVQVFIGKMSDYRFQRQGHRREFYLIGVVASLPLILWFYLAPNFFQLACAFFGLQIMLNLATGPYQAAIPDHVPPESQGLTSAWMSVLQSLGAALGLLIAGFIQQQWMVGLILASGLGLSFLPTYIHLQTLPNQTAIQPTRISWRTWLALLVSRGWMYFGFYTLLGFLLFYVRESLHIPELTAQRTDTAMIFLCFTLAAIVGAALAARPSQHWDKRLVITGATLIITGALVGMAFAQNLSLGYLLAGLAGMAWGAFVTADWALACALLPGQGMATAMGIWNLATVIPQIVAPLLIAPLVLSWDHIQPGLGPRASMLAAASGILIGTVIIWFVPSSKQVAIAMGYTNEDEFRDAPA